MNNKKEKEARIEARVSAEKKKSLIELARRKGCAGLTGLLKLLAKARDVKIEI